MLRLSPDESFHFELLRLLAHATYGGADVGEVLAIASEITPGDFESFHDAFVKRAERILEQENKATNPISIRDAMFRASTYYRAADFYIHGDWEDPRILSLWDKQTACFDQAISRLPIPGYRRVVKGPGFDIPVIFFPARGTTDEKLPTIVLGNGYDGSLEEMYHQYGAGILERGWNVLCYDGPGQICARRYQGIGFTHEWETVVSPVLDFLETLPIVNMKQIGIVGNSMAGLLAARAAAFDHRLAAVFSIDGLYNLMDTPVFDVEKGLARYSGVQDFAAAEKIFEDPSVPTTARWALSHGLWAFKVRTPAEYLEKASHFNLKGIADKIQCPVFVADAADDHFFKGQPEAMRDALGDKAHYVVFTADDAAGEHCHVGAARYTNQVMFDWFEEKIIKT
ncbi:hypothetical protein HER10_EVM0010935 [Colletotrichum scovillei]|uniref:AB hydrolase-1 domain-containing protein n=1 Tax=Colletotrichum scovillei TaxID=1209932 RepID=A0A9P7QXE9_9PEZI|nr:uncharacterized protein HER10_EVM0010935 [Colletotrichum scovillei]KAF4781375.1 hypothetical protein HER10_EVM0010935 [Colletotrichum scovillei]KAG7045169.1 hypothetical protein JMJ77_0009256 [Colletotrichum scovillei]KAG7052332.1 hypothetical protein JMJ78_0005352 [Colletotrichum scovillei]KAG7064623.1 hypothetical protein JMJ76_0012385 [Colletotrichum scovillei]